LLAKEACMCGQLPAEWGGSGMFGGRV